MTAPVDHRKCCRRAEHAGFNTGQQQDAHYEDNCRAVLVEGVLWPLAIVGFACLTAAIVWWVVR